MRYLLGKRKYDDCNNHKIQLTSSNIITNDIEFGCIVCGVRYDNKQEIKNDLSKLMNIQKWKDWQYVSFTKVN